MTVHKANNSYENDFIIAITDCYLVLLLTVFFFSYFYSKVSLSLEWGNCKVEVAQNDCSSSSHHKPTVTQFELDHTYGSCFKDRLIQLLNKYNNTGIQKYKF